MLGKCDAFQQADLLLAFVSAVAAVTTVLAGVTAATCAPALFAPVASGAVSVLMHVNGCPSVLCNTVRT